MIPNLTGNTFSGSQKETDPNTERREERVKRENLLREYDGRVMELKKNLTEKGRILEETNTKIRFGKETIDREKQELISLEGKLAILHKLVGRDVFELNQNKGRALGLVKEVNDLKNNLAIAEKKWKKIRNG
jgi:hypothetical protein